LAAGEAGPGDDPDRDGLVNLLEFALGQNPKLASHDGMPKARLVQAGGQKYLALEFVRAKQSIGATFELWTAADLTRWAAAPAVLEVVEDLDAANERVRLRHTGALDTQPVRFYLLRVKRGGE
jgi:hypothetical protein